MLIKLQEAYGAILSGRTKSYTIDDRQLTKLDLPDLFRQIKEAEKTIDELEAAIAGGKRRRAVAVVFRDW
jgi:hypothetical protein